MTQAAFENAVVAAAALGASSNCPIHMVAIARHMGVGHTLDDWQRLGPEIPLLCDVQPAGRFLGEKFHRAGGVPAVLKELLQAGKLHGGAMTVTGKTVAENLRDVADGDREVIRSYAKPMLAAAGYVVMSGNLFDSAVMKISVIDQDFRARFLSEPGSPERVRGQGDRVRGTGGLPPPHRGPRSGCRGTIGAGRPQLRPGGLSGQRRGGEHAAPGCTFEARGDDACRPWGTAGSRAPRGRRRS